MSDDRSWRNEGWRTEPRSFKAAEDSVGVPSTRRIPADFDYDENNLKPLTRVLWSLSVSMAHLLDAYDKFSKIKSAKISPDGLIGGQGYVKSIPDVRRAISEAQEVVSALVDTIHDEINGPHWRREMNKLPADEVVQIQEMVSDAEDMAKMPDQKVKDHYKREVVEDAKEYVDPLPTDESGQQYEDMTTGRPHTSARLANSNHIHNRDDLGGPRIDDRGPAEGQGPYGTYNKDEVPSPPGEQFRFINQDEGLYPSEWSGDYSSIYANNNHLWRSSSLPGYDELHTLIAEDESRTPVRKLTAFSYGLTDPRTDRDVDDLGIGYGRGDGVNDSAEELTWSDDFLGDL